MATVLTPAEIERRSIILHEVDAALCDGCGAEALAADAAADPRWWIDAAMVAHEREPYEVASIRCPACW